MDMNRTFSKTVDRLKQTVEEKRGENEAIIKAADRRKREVEVRINVAALHADMGDRYGVEQCAFGNYTVYDRVQNEVFETVAHLDVTKMIETGGGIILYGYPGTGKDHLMAAFMYKAIALHGYACRWINGRAWFALAKDKIIKEDKPERAMLKAEASPQILTIADPIPLSGAAISNWNLDLLYQVIDERYRARRPTCVTINLQSEAAIRDALSGPVADRLLHNATLLRCSWPSYRRPCVQKADQKRT
jgi:DNA replication protein DnaC